MSETLPYIVFAGSVAAVLVGIGVKIALERSSGEPVLSERLSVSSVGEASATLEASLPTISEGSSIPVGGGDDAEPSREVVGLESNVGSEVGEAVTARRGGSRRRKRRKVGKRLERRIVRLYRKGKSPKEIAEELGISTSTVYRKLRKLVSVKG